MFYICKYSDYTELPDKLFCVHSPSGHERRSLDGSRFIARCRDNLPSTCCLSWMNGTEPTFNHAEILTEMQEVEWSEVE